MTEICQKRVKIEGDAFHKRILHKSVENDRTLSKKRQNRRRLRRLWILSRKSAFHKRIRHKSVENHKVRKVVLFYTYAAQPFFLYIRVRGSPFRGIFSWARWGQGRGQIPELLARRRRRWTFPQNTKKNLMSHA